MLLWLVYQNQLLIKSIEWSSRSQVKTKNKQKNLWRQNKYNEIIIQKEFLHN